MQPEEVRNCYEECAAALRDYAMSLLDDKHRAEDIVQEVFRSLLRDQLEAVEEARPYLFKCVRNGVLKSLRDASRESRAHLGLAEKWAAAVAGADEESRVVRSAVWILPDNIRDVVMLHYWGGLSLRKVADVLQVPETTVTYWHRQAKDLLRAALNKLLVE